MNEKKETYEQSIRRRPILRVMAWVGLAIIASLIVLAVVTGITGSKYFLPCLALMMIVPILIYVILWIGKVLKNHRENRS